VEGPGAQGLTSAVVPVYDFHRTWRSRMMIKSMTPAKLALVFALVLPVMGCMAGAAAAGAGAGIYLTTRGAESIVGGSIADVAARAQAVMTEEGIVAEDAKTEDGGDKREFKGKKGDLDVTIEMKRESDKTTRVEVTARESLAEWDKEYAQQLLSRIVEKG
jgi:hypothetical protein